MELISKVSVHPLHRQDFRSVIKAFVDGEISEDLLVERAKNIGNKHMQMFIDVVNGEATLYSVGMTGIPQDDEKATRLFHLAEMLEKEL